jgi:hypothetical protein
MIGFGIWDHKCDRPAEQRGIGACLFRTSKTAFQLSQNAPAAIPGATQTVAAIGPLRRNDDGVEPVCA